MDQDIEPQDALETPDETLDLELEQGTEAEPEIVDSTPEGDESLDDMRAKLQKTNELNKRLFNRAKDAETELKKHKKGKTEDAKAPTQSDEIEQVLSLRAEGYTDGEILSLRTYAKKMNTTIREVASDEFIKAGIETKRAKLKASEATPPPSNRSVTVKGKTWETMTDAERRTNFSSVVKQFKK